MTGRWGAGVVTSFLAAEALLFLMGYPPGDTSARPLVGGSVELQRGGGTREVLRPCFAGRFYGADVRVNSLGYRGPEPAAGRRYRLLLLGTSFTFAAGVDDESSLARTLERTLGAAGRDVEVINCGGPGYGWAQVVDVADVECRRLDPDEVWVVVDAHLRSQRWERRPRPAAIRDAPVVGLPTDLGGAAERLNAAAMRSRAVTATVAVAQRLERRLARGGATAAAATAGGELEGAELDGVLAVRDAVVQLGIRAVAVVLPDVEPAGRRPAPAAAAVVGAIGGSGIEVIDLTRLTEGACERSGWLRPDDSHANPILHRAVGRAMAAAFLAREKRR
jgi:hypothetical protein